MDNAVALYHRHRVLAAIAALPMEPSAEQIGQAVDALHNALKNGSPHDGGERSGGYVFPDLDL